MVVMGCDVYVSKPKGISTSAKVAKNAVQSDISRTKPVASRANNFLELICSESN
jgi:hypothetical protein